MAGGAVVAEPTQLPIQGDESSLVVATVDIDRRRYVRAVAVGLAAVSIPYLWILWDLWSGTAHPLRQYSPDNFYDLQARAMLAGHLWLPPGSIGIEAFLHDGHQYTYFGLFPSLLRMPVLLVTHRFDGQLTAPSMLLSWLVTGLFSSLLCWRVRVLVRGEAALGWAEASCYGVFVAAISGGSVLLYLAASPRVSHEDLAWSAALTIAAAFALVGVIERPSWGRVLASGGLILAAALDRSPTGYACILAALLVAGWLALGRAGRDRRKWAWSTAVAGLVPLVVAVLVNEAKFGKAFGFSEADQVWTQVNAHRRLYLATSGGSGFGLHFLPTTLVAYLQPAGIHFQAAFPYITLPTSPAAAVGRVILDQSYPTASVTASMPLLLALACWGVVTAFRPRPLGPLVPVRLLLVATATATGGVLLFGYIADRYLADFLPFLVLAGIIGLVDIWRRVDGQSRRSVRVVTVAAIVVLGLFSWWANVGAAITPSALWTTTQARNFVSFQKSVSGGAVARLVRQGSSLPYFAPAGDLFIVGDCSGLYVSTGFSYATVPGQQLQHETWDAVEQSAGFNHLIQVEYTRAVTTSDPPLVVMTYGRSSLALVPTGTNRVRLVLENGGAPAVIWPPASTSSFAVQPGKPFPMYTMTDPNLQTIVTGAMGVGIQHYLAGTGPAVVQVSGSGPGAAPLAVVRDVPLRPPSLGLCRSLLRNAH